MLDTCNEMHLFCLHLVYLDLINEALDEFSDEWNNQYTLITETNFSPRQLWVSGIICNQSCTAVQDVIRYSSYGIDEEGPVPEHEDYEIVVPQSPISLSEEQLHHVTKTFQYFFSCFDTFDFMHIFFL